MHPHLEAVGRAAVLFILSWVSWVHYQGAEWWYLAGDFVVFLLIGYAWFQPFLAARRGSRKR